ncbi:hypothetical protein JCM5296_001231 [Sporobolomyces johnsonii]
MEPTTPAVLVPATQTTTADQPGDAADSTFNSHFDSHSQSYLLDAIRRGPHSSPAPRLPPQRSLAASRSEDGVVLARAKRARFSQEPDQDEEEVEGEEGDLSTVADSQVPRPNPASSPHSRSRRAHRDSDAIDYSVSQPVEGPGNSGEYGDGFLGGTQAQSLDASWKKSRRTSGGSSRMTERQGEGEGEEMGVQEDEADGEVSMDLTRAGGGLLDNENGEEHVPLPISPDGQPDSQKENPSSRPSTNPTPSAPFSLRTSFANLENDAPTPSSSPAIARELLQRSPSKRRPSQLHSVKEPASSVDSDIDIATGEIVSPRQRSQLRGRSEELGDDLPDLPLARPSASTSTSIGPETSTPSYAAAPPPNPVTATRSVPAYTFLSRTAEGTHPPSTSTGSAAASARATVSARGPVNVDLFASSAAMKAPLPPAQKKRQKEAWDGISQDTEEESASTVRGSDEKTDEESPALAQTLVHVEDEDASMGGSGDQGTPKPTAERTIDMELDEGDSTRYGMGDALLDMSGNLPSTIPADESIRHASPPAQLPSRPPLSTGTGDESSLELDLRLRPGEKPLFASALSSSSPSHSQDGSRRPDGSGSSSVPKSKRLSDISELRSSQDAPQPTQIEVESTQKEYDVEKMQSSSKTAETEIDNSTHQPFMYNTSTETKRSRQQSMAAPGRELRYQTAPPTPVHSDPRSSPRQPSPPAEQPSSAELPSPKPSSPANFSSPAKCLSPGERLRQSHTVEDSLLLPEPPLPFPPPRQSQPAQKVVESSPDVPLASKRARAQQQAQAERQLSPSARAGPSSAVQPATISPNGVIPDSEGPTQAAPESAPRPPPVVSTSTARDDASARDIPPLRFFNEQHEVRADKGETLSDSADEAEEEVAPAKGKAVKRTATGKAKSKGKEKEKATPDVEDLPPHAPSKKKGKRNAKEAPVDEEEEEAEAPSKKRKRDALLPEPVPPSLKAKPTRRASTPKKVAVVEVVKPATTKKPAGARKGVATSRSAEPPQPVAGPSRLRYQSLDQGADLAATDTESTISSSSKSKIRLPPSAPFTRMLGMWRDDGWFYAGTILSLSNGFFHVRFDDDSTGRLRPHELLRCELKRGDIIQYYGNDFAGESQAEGIPNELRVLRAERGTTGDDVEGELYHDDVVVATELTDLDASGPKHRLQVEGIRISVSRAHQFEDRKVTPTDIAAFEGRDRIVVKPLPLLAPPTRPDTTAFEDSKKAAGLFSRMAFLVTQADKGDFVNKLKANGGTIIEWEHLFEAKGTVDNQPPTVSFPRRDFEKVDTILLLADRPCTTIKYLIALALGVPCCSSQFALDSIKETTRLDWRAFLITSGYVQSLQTYGLGGQLRALTKSTLNLDSLATAQAGSGLFKDRSFLVVTGKKGKKLNEKERSDLNSRNYKLLSLLASCSASRVHFIALPLPASSSLSASDFTASVSAYSHVFLTDDIDHSPPAAAKPLMSHKGLVNIVWLKQCLMAGRVLPSARMKEVAE